MPINFQSLFQDVWNFIRNRPNFTFSGTVLLALLTIAIRFVVPQQLVSADDSATVIREQLSATTLLLPSLLSMAVVVFVNVLLILNIKSINGSNYTTFFKNSSAALMAFVPAMLLTLIQVFPISLGLAFALFPALGNTGPLVALPLMITGLFVFIKLNIAIYVYLIEEPRKSIGETLKSTWLLSRGRMLPLIIFTAVIYFIPTVLNTIFSSFQSLGFAGVVISDLANAFVNLAMVIFSFRFYQSYRQ